MRIVCFILAVAVMTLQAFPAFADREAGNAANVAAGKYGRCYAKSVPKHTMDPFDEPRQQGQTKVYRVSETEDELINTYDWFSHQLYLVCNAMKEENYGVAVIRLGPWHRGNEPNHEALALAFYFDGALVKKYSTLDIAGKKRGDVPWLSENVRVSVSHYSIFKKQPDLVWKKSQKEYGVETPVVEAVTVDGRKLTFDVATGEIIETKSGE